MKKAVLLAAALFLFSASAAFAQAPAPVVPQETMDAALQELSGLYGSPVVRADQARAICNEEQYVVECAKIGKKYGLFPKEREREVDALLLQFKGKVVEELKACGNTECLIEVATKIAAELSASNPALARDVDLTPQKVEEKRSIVAVAKSAGVDIEECRAMDPDSASVEFLRACAKLAKNDQIRQHIPEERRGNAERTENTAALKEALARGDYRCGDNTVDGCGAYCLSPGAATQEEGTADIPQVCRQIAERFFGPDGVRELERSYGVVHRAYDEIKEIYVERREKEVRREISTTTPRLVCPITDYAPCPQGEYRQEYTNELGCFIRGTCIPFNTKTEEEQKKDRQVICPALPTVDSCGTDEEKIISYTSPECGTYYSCKPKAEERGTKYPHSFASGRVVLSFEEARVYCYESGSGGATARGDKAECFEKFGIAVPDISPEKQCAEWGAGWHSMDESGNCFNPSMTEYRTPRGGLRGCTEAPVYGCSTTERTEPGAGQKEQAWNSSGLRSWIRSDAPEERIAELKTACVGVSSNANVWLPGAGTFSNDDFGMPDPEKCRKATLCTRAEYFDGSACSALNTTQWCSSSQYWNGSSCVPYTTSATSNDTSTTGTASGSCSAELINLLGSGCHSMGNAWFNSAMTEYVMPGGVVVRTCASSYVSGCSGGSATTNTGSTAEAGCRSAGGTWDSARNYCTMPNESSCPAGYWSGTACTYTSGGGNTSGMQRCFYPNASISGRSPGYTVWCERDYYNCREGDPSGAPVSLSELSLGAPSSCESGWTGGSTGSGATIGSECRSQSSQSACSAISGCYWYTGYSGGYCDSSGSAASSGGAGSSCDTGQYWDTQTSSCRSNEGACAEAGGVWNSSQNYCTMPGTSSGGSPGSYSSCPSGQYWSGSACVTSSSDSSGSTTSCPSGQWWNGTSCVTTTTSDTPNQSGCTLAGGTWDSAANYCRMPSSSPSSSAASPLAYLCPSGHLWNGSYCILTEDRSGGSYLANVFSAFLSLFKF